MAKEPFLGVPQGRPHVENPDGVFRPDGSHSLYDTGQLPRPTIPGDYENTRPAGNTSGGDDPSR